MEMIVSFMFGDNPIRKPVKGDGKALDVQSVFATVQGEGMFTGWPAVFIRLGGCNLACHFCDTEFESFGSWSFEHLFDEVERLSVDDSGKRLRDLVVITGGEPMRQPIERMCWKLANAGYQVQIETNGTLFRDVDERVKIVCSPKNTGNGYAAIRGDLLPRIDAFKFIVSAFDPLYSDVAEVGQSGFDIPVYVQPMDEYDETKNKANFALATKIAMEKGCRLSLQVHKIVGVA